MPPAESTSAHAGADHDASRSAALRRRAEEPTAGSEALKVGQAIRIGARSVEDQVLIEVADSAGGLPPEEAARLFEPSFSRTDGGGLGLYLTRMLVERNGGRIEHVPLDGGSCFRVFLPIESDDLDGETGGELLV